MVKASKPLSVEKVQEYYVHEFTAAGQSNYYTEGKTLAGIWHGDLASKWGLSGAVDATHYDRMAVGQHPHTAEQLIKHQKNRIRQPWEKSRAAWRKHLEELYCTAIFEGRDLFRESSDGMKRQSREGAERLEPLQDQPITERAATLIEMHRIAAEVYRENLASDAGVSARDYLKRRNVTDESVREFGLGVSNGPKGQLLQKLQYFGPELMEASGLFRRDRFGRWHERFENRLMFPIHNRAGDIVGFGARKLEEDAFGPKYINSPATEIYRKGETLYNAHRAAEPAENKDQIQVVEGYLDAIAAYQTGLKNVVAACGTSLNTEAVKTLSKNVILNMDGDAAGRDAALKHSEALLKDGLRVRVADIPGDPDEYIEDHGPESYRKKIEKARPLVEWLAVQAKAKFIEDAPGARRAEATADAVHWVVDVLANVQGKDRAAISEEVAAYLKVDQGLMEVPKHSEHISAWDIMIAPNKSYSVTALVGGDQGLIDDHNEAVRIALDAGQEYAQARMGNNNAPLTTGNWACAVFRHDTARPVGAQAPNPQLHSHCVVFNMTDANGQIRAMTAREIFRVQTYINAVFEAETAYRARARGYELEQGKNFSTQIKGYTPEYLEAVSARAVEIEREKAAKGLVGAEADERINKRLRQPKQEWAPEALWAEHRRQAEGMGSHPAQVVAEAKYGVSHELTGEQRRKLADEAIDYAKHRLYEGQAVVDRYELFRDALRFGAGYIRLPDVKAAFEERFVHREGEFIETHHYREGAPGARYTTGKHRMMETEILQRTLAGKGVTEPILRSAMTREEYRDRYKERIIDGRRITLNNSQMWMSWKVLTAPDQHTIIHGWAGVGKTTALQPIAELAAKSGYEVHGLAPTGAAANNLAELDISCQTVQGHLFRQKYGQDAPDRRRLYIVDEASLFGSQEMYDFLQTVRSQDRVIHAYDPGQHQAVGASRIVEAMEEAGVTTFNMKKIVRQRERPELLKAVEHLAKRETGEALKLLEEQNRIFEYADRAKRFAVIARYYGANFGRCRIVTPDNRSIEEIDAAVRGDLRARAILGEDVYEGKILIGVRDVREADRKCAGRYNAGDVIRFGKEVNFLGVESGQYATVKRVDAEKNLLTIEVETKVGHRQITYDPRQAYGVELFETKPRSFAVGERVQITRPWKVGPGVKIANRSAGIIRELDKDGNCLLELDGEAGHRRRIRFSLNDMRHVNYAYAMTSYSQQWATSEKVVVHIDTEDTQARSVTDQALAYVGISRGAKEVAIVTNSREELLGPNSPVLRVALKPKALAKQEIESMGKVRVA